MKFLLFLSLALCLLTACSHKVAPLSSHKLEAHFWLPQLRDSVQKNSYRIALGAGRANISGIWMVKRINESWRGTLVNEFGLKVFDFICTAGACELKNVVAIADRRRIKKTIADDVQFMLEIDNAAYKAGQLSDRSWSNDTLTIAYKKEKVLRRFASGEMVMHNKRRNLTYSLKKMEE